MLVEVVSLHVASTYNQGIIQSLSLGVGNSVLCNLSENKFFDFFFGKS